MIDAVVLAGSPNIGQLKDCSSAENEALINIGDRAMIDYVITALQGSSEIGRIVVVGPVKELSYLREKGNIIIAPSGRTAIESVENGIALLETDSMVLIATSDIPLITSTAIDDFLNLCRGKQGDLFYPIVPKEVNDLKYPGVRRTYVRLKEGKFTGGNLFLVNPAVVRKCAEKAEQFVAYRKKPLSLCKLIGFGFVIKYLFHRLSLAEAERQVSKLLSIKGFGVISSYPEVGIDVDKPSDLELVRKVLAPSS